MAKPILLLRLEGPLQAWGVRSRWDVRDTGPEPTKSGIIGLLGCALGYPMHDPRLESELNAGLRFGVRVEHPGTVTVDYQTITHYLPVADGGYKFRGGTGTGPPSKLEAEGKLPATIISPRAYLEDAAFLVALEERPAFDGLAARCAQALQAPQWPLFLGRKACIPTRPIFESCVTSYDGLEEALARHPWEWLGACYKRRNQKLPEGLTAFIEDETGDLLRQDAIRINAARTYDFRPVRPAFFKPVLPPDQVAPVEA